MIVSSLFRMWTRNGLSAFFFNPIGCNDVGGLHVETMHSCMYFEFLLPVFVFSLCVNSRELCYGSSNKSIQQRYAIRPVVMRCCTRSDIVLIHAHDRMRLPLNLWKSYYIWPIDLIKTTI